MFCLNVMNRPNLSVSQCLVVFSPSYFNVSLLQIQSILTPKEIVSFSVSGFFLFCRLGKWFRTDETRVARSRSNSTGDDDYVVPLRAANRTASVDSFMCDEHVRKSIIRLLYFDIVSRLRFSVVRSKSSRYCYRIAVSKHFSRKVVPTPLNRSFPNPL